MSFRKYTPGAIAFLFSVILILVSTSSCVKDRLQPVYTPPVDTTTPPPVDTTSADTSVHLLDYWNFNSDDTVQMLIPNDSVNSPSITYVANYYDAYSPSSLLNARNNDSAGNALRMRNPFTSITFNTPSTGYKNLVLQFSAEKSSNGPITNNIYYTLDGTNFINTNLNETSFALDTTFALYKIDFSGISGANNNSKFAVQFVTQDDNTGTSGNDRFDNVTLEGMKN